MPNRSLRLSLLLSALLVLTGCSLLPGGEESAAPSSAPTTDAPATTTPTTVVDDTTTTTEEAEEPVLETDWGVTDSTIRIGYSLDLTGPYSSHDLVVRAVHEAYFDDVNNAGGIDGRDIDLVFLDNGFDVPLHLDNLAQLSEPSDEGVVAIGDLSHPLFGDASVSVLGDSGLLALANLLPDERAAGATTVQASAGSLCRETAAALGALAPVDGGARRRLALLSRDEPWAVSSADAARSLAEAQGFDIVLDVVGVDTPGDVVSQLVAIEADVVWLAVSPRDLVELSAALGQVNRSWRWAGTSLTFDSSVFESEAAAALARVYIHTSGIEPIDLAPSQLRRKLVEVLPALTYGEAATASAAWEQASRIHDALEESIGESNATRAGVARAARDLSTDVDIGLYRLDPRNATTGLSISDDAGMVGLVIADDLVVPSENLASCR